MSGLARTLVYGQIIGGICCIAGALVPKGHSDDTFWFSLVLFPAGAGAAAAIAGFLYLLREPRALHLALLVQAAQVFSFSSGWRFVFRSGLWATWVIDSAGTGLVPGLGGMGIATAHPSDGSLNAVGCFAQFTVGLFGREMDRPTWSLGINLVALYFTVQLWRVLQYQNAQHRSTTIPAA